MNYSYIECEGESERKVVCALQKSFVSECNRINAILTDVSVRHSSRKAGILKLHAVSAPVASQHVKNTRNEAPRQLAHGTSPVTAAGSRSFGCYNIVKGALKCSP